MTSTRGPAPLWARHPSRAMVSRQVRLVWFRPASCNAAPEGTGVPVVGPDGPVAVVAAAGLAAAGEPPPAAWLVAIGATSGRRSEASSAGATTRPTTRLAARPHTMTERVRVASAGETRIG